MISGNYSVRATRPVTLMVNRLTVVAIESICRTILAVYHFHVLKQTRAHFPYLYRLSQHVRLHSPPNREWRIEHGRGETQAVSVPSEVISGENP